MSSRNNVSRLLGVCLALSLVAVGCGSDGSTSETDLSTTESAETSTSSLEVVSAEWSSFCASEQSVLEGDLRATTTVPLDYAQLEEALAPGGTPISDDAADLLTSLGTVAETWDELGSAIVNAMVDVDVNLDDPGWTVLTGEKGVLLVNFQYEIEGGPLALPVEPEAIALSDASSALTVKAQEIGLEECGLLTGEAEQTGPDSPSASTAAPPPEQATGEDFQDQFDGALGGGWKWRSEVPDLWSLTATPGWLQITAVEAAQNVLWRGAPENAYEITTALRFRPTSSFQFAGLSVGTDEANFLQLGRAYCDPVEVPDICVGDGVYLDNVENDEMQSPSIVEIATDTDVVYLRFVVDGDSYAGFVSEDGATWTLVGERTRSFEDQEIRLMAYQAYQEPAVAEFDYITVTALSNGAAPTAASGTDATDSSPATATEADLVEFLDAFILRVEDNASLDDSGEITAAAREAIEWADVSWPQVRDVAYEILAVEVADALVEAIDTMVEGLRVLSTGDPTGGPTVADGIEKWNEVMVMLNTP